MLEVNYTLRIAKDTRDRFTDAVKTKERHRKAAQVMRELMDAYAEGRVVITSDLAPAKISDDERRRRREAVDYGHGSVTLEGFKQTPEAKAHAERFVNGDIDFNEYMSPSFAAVHDR